MPHFSGHLYEFWYPKHIISQIPQSDFCRYTNASNGSRYQVARDFQLNAEGVFNSRTNPGTRSIALPLPGRQLLAATTLPVDFVPKTILGKYSAIFLRSVSRVRVNILTPIRWIEQCLKNIAVMDRCVRHFIRSNQLVFDVHADVILVTVMAFVIFHHPFVYF